MFTSNNYVLQRGEKFGEEYKKVAISDLRLSDHVITAQLPECVVTFPVEVEEIERNDLNSDGAILVYQLNLINTKGDRYCVEVTPSTQEAFCRFSKFKQLANIVNWYQNFALVDWLGLPCKIESIKEAWYHGPLFGISVKDTNNLIVSGIVFRSKSDGDETPTFDLENE
jgi:hypothetical protein